MGWRCATGALPSSLERGEPRTMWFRFCLGLCYGLGHGLWFRLHLVFRVSVSGSGVCYDVYSLWSPVFGLAVYVFWIGHSCSFAPCLRCYRRSVMPPLFSLRCFHRWFSCCSLVYLCLQSVVTSTLCRLSMCVPPYACHEGAAEMRCKRARRWYPRTLTGWRMMHSRVLLYIVRILHQAIYELFILRSF